MRPLPSLGLACSVGIATAISGCGAPSPPPTMLAPELPAQPGKHVDYGALLFPSASPAPSASAPPVPETGIASWSSETDERGPVWVRSHGRVAPDLVIRGTTAPTHPDYMERGAHEAQMIHLKTLGPVPRLRVWAKGTGPMEIIAGLETVAGSKGDTLIADLAERIDQLPGGRQETRKGMEGDIYLQIRDVDRPNERRGQTAPFVLVITEDPDAPRLETPDPVARPSDAVTVRWDMTPVACTAEYDSSCYRAVMILGNGARFAIPHRITAQSDCYPEGAGMLCAGASGGTLYNFKVAPDGQVTLMANYDSDGACEPAGADCWTHTAVLTFHIPRGDHLIADPLGTFPPLPASAFAP